MKRLFSLIMAGGLAAAVLVGTVQHGKPSLVPAPAQAYPAYSSRTSFFPVAIAAAGALGAAGAIGFLAKKFWDLGEEAGRADYQEDKRKSGGIYYPYGGLSSASFVLD